MTDTRYREGHFTALAKNPDFTRRFVNSCNLPADELKLYVRKARESFRTRTVSPY